MPDPIKIRRVTIRLVDARQSRRPSIALRVTVAALMVSTLFGPALMFDNAAMAWTGFVISMLLAAAIITSLKDDYLTIDEARAKLAELERDDA